MKETVVNENKCACGNKKGVDEISCEVCFEDLRYKIAKRLQPNITIVSAGGFVSLDEFITAVKECGVAPVGTCVICGGNYIWGGNNPAPVANGEDDRCCSFCCDNVVMPARFEGILKESSGKQRG